MSDFPTAEAAYGTFAKAEAEELDDALSQMEWDRIEREWWGKPTEQIELQEWTDA